MKNIENSTDNLEVKEIIKELLKQDDMLLVGSQVETNGWVNTGIKSLNFALSGDVDKGIPWGRMLVVAGESQSGKSFLGGRFATFAQKQDGFIPVWIDSEFATDKRFFKRIGLNEEEMVYRRVGSAGDFQKVILKLLKTAQKYNAKLFIILDSLGAISGNKAANDAEQEKDLTSDMGQRAKDIRSIIKNILPWLGHTDSILYCVNHIYIEPGFIPKKTMSGGMAPAFLAQQVLFLTKKKSEPGISTKVGVFVKKNREFIEERKLDFTINFTTGLDENEGILDVFLEFGIIEEKGGWYKIDNKSYRESQILEDKELFKSLLEKLKEKTKDLNYHSFTDETESDI